MKNRMSLDNKIRSKKHEKRVATKLNGRTTPATGAKWHSKGDVRTDSTLIECKTTTKNSFRLTKNLWEKIEKEAMRDGLRVPVMYIEIQGNKFVVFKLGRIQFSQKVDVNKEPQLKPAYSMILSHLKNWVEVANSLGKTIALEVEIGTHKLYIMEESDFEFATVIDQPLQ